MSLGEASLPSLMPRGRSATGSTSAASPTGLPTTSSADAQQMGLGTSNTSHEGHGYRPASQSARHLFDVAPAYQSFVSGGRTTQAPPLSNNSSGHTAGVRHPSRPLEPPIPSTERSSAHRRGSRGDSGNPAHRTTMGIRPITDSFVGNPGALVASQSAASLSISRGNSLTFGALAGALGTAFSFTSRSSQAQTPMFLQDQHASVMGSFETTGSGFFADGHHPAIGRSGSIHRVSPRSSLSPLHASRGPSRHTKLPSVTSIIRTSIVATEQARRTSTNDEEGEEPTPGINDKIGSLRRMLRKASSTTFSNPLFVSGGAKQTVSVVYDRDDDENGNTSSQAFPSDTTTTGGGVPFVGVIGHTSQAMRFVASTAFERFRDLFELAEGRPVAFTPAHRTRGSGGGGSAAVGKLNTFRSRSPGQAMADDSRMMRDGTPNAHDGSLTPDVDAAPSQPHGGPTATRGRQSGRGSEVVAMPSDLDDFGRGEEALRKYRDVSQLCRSVFPGAAAAKAAAAGLAVDGSKELEARMVARTTRWLEANQSELLLGTPQNPLNTSWTSNPNLLSALSPTGAPGGQQLQQQQMVPQAIMTSTPEVFQLAPKDVNILFSAWRHRKTGALFQRAFNAVSMALRALMVPGALVTTPLNITYAIGGELVTATWLPPTTSAFPMKLVPKSLLSEISRQLTATLLGSFFATTSNSFGAFQEEDGGGNVGGVAEDHVPAVDFYACADGAYCAVPNANLIDALSMQRCETVLLNESTERMYYASSSASKKLMGIGVMGESPELVNINRVGIILVRVAPMVFHEQRVEGSDKGLTTLLRDVLHANGVQMRELLNVRESVEKRCQSSGGMMHGRDQQASFLALMQFILNEAVARTLKAMILSRAATSMHQTPSAGGGLMGSSGGGGDRCTSPPRGRGDHSSKQAREHPTPTSSGTAATTIPNCPAHAAAIIDAANLIFRKFLTSPKFLRESLVPALNKRFVSVAEYTIDPKMFLVRDIAAFLQSRLGLCYNAEEKHFSPYPLPVRTHKTVGKLHSPTLLRGPGVSAPQRSPPLGHAPNPSVPGVLISTSAPARQPFFVSMLTVSFKSPVSPSGAIAQSLVTECTGTYLQQLSLTCGEAEVRARAERKGRGGSPTGGRGALPNVLSGSDESKASAEVTSPLEDMMSSCERPGSSASPTVRPSRPLAPADAACLLHLNQLLFASLTSSSVHSPNSSSSAKAGNGSDGMAKTSVLESHQANAGIGPSIVRLQRRISRLFHVPATVLATLHHVSQDTADPAADPTKTSTSSTRPTSPASSHSKPELSPLQGTTPLMDGLQSSGPQKGATPLHPLPAIPQPPLTQHGPLSGRGTQRVSRRNSRGQEERPSIASFTVHEMETILQLMCVDKQYSASTMEPEDVQDLATSLRGGRGGVVRSVPACDSLLISTMVELSMLNQRSPIEALGNIDERLLHSAGVGGGFTTVTIDPLMLWAMAVSNMGGHVFDPFLLHHATRALLLAKLLNKDAAAQWGAVLTECNHRAHHQQMGEEAVPQLAHEVLRAVCNAICICSTASPTAMLTSDTAMLLSTGLAFFGTPAATEERKTAFGASYLGPEGCLAPFALRCAAFLTRRTVLQQKMEHQNQRALVASNTHHVSQGAAGVGSGSLGTAHAATGGGGGDFPIGGVAISQSYSTDELLSSQMRAMPAASILFVAMMAPYLLSISPGHDPLVGSIASSATAATNERRSSTSTGSSESMRHLRGRWVAFVDALQSLFAHRIQHMIISEESQSARAMGTDVVSETASHCSTPAVEQTPHSFGFGSPLAEHFAFHGYLDDDACWGLIQQSPAVQDYLSTLRFVLMEEGYTRHRSPGSKQNLAVMMEFAGVGCSVSTDASGGTNNNAPQVFLEDASMPGTEFLWSTPDVLKYFTHQLDLMAPQLSAAFEHSSRLSAEGTEDPFSYPVSFEVGDGAGGSTTDGESHQISSSSAHSIGQNRGSGTLRAADETSPAQSDERSKGMSSSGMAQQQQQKQQQDEPATPQVDVAQILSTSTATYDGQVPPFLQGDSTNEYRSFAAESSSHASMLLEALCTSSPAPNPNTSSRTTTPTTMHTTEDGLLSPHGAARRVPQETGSQRGSANTTPKCVAIEGATADGSAALDIEEGRRVEKDAVVMEVPELGAASPPASQPIESRAERGQVVNESAHETVSRPPDTTLNDDDANRDPLGGGRHELGHVGEMPDNVSVADCNLERTTVDTSYEGPPRCTTTPSPQHSGRPSPPVSPELFLDVPSFLTGAQRTSQFLSTSTATSEGVAPPSLAGTNEYRSFGISSSHASMALEEMRRVSNVTTSLSTITTTTATVSTNDTLSSRATTQRPQSTQEEMPSTVSQDVSALHSVSQPLFDNEAPTSAVDERPLEQRVIREPSLEHTPSTDLQPPDAALPTPSPPIVRRLSSESRGHQILSRRGSSLVLHPHQPSPHQFRRGSHVRSMLEHVSEQPSNWGNGSGSLNEDGGRPAGDLQPHGDSIRSTLSDSSNSPRHRIAHLVMILSAEEEIRRDILADEELDAMSQIRQFSEFSHAEARGSSPDGKVRPFTADGTKGIVAVSSPNGSGTFSQRHRASQSTSPPSDSGAAVAPTPTAALATFAVPQPPTNTLHSCDAALLDASSRASSAKSPEHLDQTASYAQTHAMTRPNTTTTTPLSSPSPPLDDQEDARMMTRLFNQAFESREMLMRGSIVLEESITRSHIAKNVLSMP